MRRETIYFGQHIKVKEEFVVNRTVETSWVITDVGQDNPEGKVYFSGAPILKTRQGEDTITMGGTLEPQWIEEFNRTRRFSLDEFIAAVRRSDLNDRVKEIFVAGYRKSAEQRPSRRITWKK